KTPIHGRGRALARLVIRTEPRAAAHTVAHDEPLRLDLELGEVGEDGAERLGIAATFRVPLPAAQGWTYPISDARRAIEDNRRPRRPTRIADRLIAHAAKNERQRRLRLDGEDREGAHHNEDGSQSGTLGHGFTFGSGGR